MHTTHVCLHRQTHTHLYSQSAHAHICTLSHMHNHMCCSRMHVCTGAHLTCLHTLTCFHSHAHTFPFLCTLTHRRSRCSGRTGLGLSPGRRRCHPAPARRRQVRPSRSSTAEAPERVHRLPSTRTYRFPGARMGLPSGLGSAVAI